MVVALHALTVAHDTYDGRIVPYFRSRQLYYERYYKRHGHYAGRGQGCRLTDATELPHAPDGPGPDSDNSGAGCSCPTARAEETDPSPRCCIAEDCLAAGHRRRHAVVSALRTDAYLPMLQARANQGEDPVSRAPGGWAT